MWADPTPHCLPLLCSQMSRELATFRTQAKSVPINLIPRIEAGTVWVNSHVPVDPNLPFGGYKQSGIGREFGRGAVEAFTELKSVCIAY